MKENKRRCHVNNTIKQSIKRSEEQEYINTATSIDILYPDSCINMFLSLTPFNKLYYRIG